MSEQRRYHIGGLPSRLVREAREMLREGGLKQLNLRALAGRAGITAGSMYHHYRSKADLLGALATGGFVELRRELEAAGRGAGLEQRLSGWALAYCRFADREPALFALMFDPEIAASPQVAAARAAVVAQLRQVVSEVARRYGRAGQRLDEITLAVWAAAHGAATLGASDPSGAKLMDDVVAGLEALFGVGAAEP
jgi:AcrR family transcriptional regulator